MVMNSAGFAKRLPPERIFGDGSRGIGGAVERAATCTECGDCEERCPYDLVIREIIDERVDWYKEAKQQYLEQATST